MSIYRMNGTTKVAELTTQNVDWTTSTIPVDTGDSGIKCNAIKFGNMVVLTFSGVPRSGLQSPLVFSGALSSIPLAVTNGQTFINAPFVLPFSDVFGRVMVHNNGNLAIYWQGALAQQEFCANVIYSTVS